MSKICSAANRILLLFAIRQEARAFLSRAAWHKHNSLRYFYTHPTLDIKLVLTGVGAQECQTRLKQLFKQFPELLEYQTYNVGTAGELRPGAEPGFTDPNSAEIIEILNPIAFKNSKAGSSFEKDVLVSIGSPDDYQQLVSFVSHSEDRILVDMEAASLLEFFSRINKMPTFIKIISDTNTDFAQTSQRDAFAAILPGFSESLYHYLAPKIGLK